MSALLRLFPLLLLPSALFADANSNPCIQNWAATSWISQPSVSVSASFPEGIAAPGQTTLVHLTYTITPGQKIVEDLAQCGDSGPQIQSGGASFGGGGTTYTVVVPYPMPAMPPVGGTAYMEAPGIVLYPGDGSSSGGGSGSSSGTFTGGGTISIPVAGTPPPPFSSVDSDKDGLLDDWEYLYFSSLAQTASGDFDNDGAMNLAEAHRGTNPAVPDAFKDPMFHPAPGTRTGYIAVAVVNPVGRGVMRYTLNGTTPTLASPVIRSGDLVPILQFGTTQLRVGIFERGTVVKSVTASYTLTDPLDLVLPPARDFSFGELKYTFNSFVSSTGNVGTTTRTQSNWYGFGNNWMVGGCASPGRTDTRWA